MGQNNTVKFAIRRWVVVSRKFYIMKAPLLIKKKAQLSDILTAYGILCKSNSSNLTTQFSNDGFIATDEKNADVDLENDFKSDAFKKKVQEAEIQISTFFLEHNLPFSIASEFIGLFQNI